MLPPGEHLVIYTPLVYCVCVFVCVSACVYVCGEGEGSGTTSNVLIAKVAILVLSVVFFGDSLRVLIVWSENP